MNYADSIESVSMFRYPAIYLLIFFILSSSISAQNQFSTLSGKITDESNSPLAGVSISIVGTKLGTISLNDGTFVFDKLDEGTYTLQFSFIGHETVVKKNVQVKTNKREFLSIVLRARDIEMKGIDIIRDATHQSQEDTRISVQKMDPRDAKILPGAAEDVLRSLQAMPGVLAPNDFSSQLIIRGSGPDQNLIVMDEVEVFNPYRLYGAVSMFNPETVTDINLLTGGFPAKYGNRLSAVLDVVNREGKRDNIIFGNINTSLTNANIVFEGTAPFGVNGSWLLSSRRTYYDLIIGPIARNAGLVSGDVAFPNFGDIQTKFVFGPFENHRFIINGVTSRDGVDVITGENRKSPDSVAVLNSTINNIISASWYYTPTNRTLNKFVLSWYDNHGKTEFDGKFLDPVLNRDEFTGPQNDSIKAFARLFGISVNSSFTLRKYSVKDEFTYELDGHLLESGLGFDYITADIFFNLDMSPELKKIIESNPRGSAIIQNTVQSQQYTKTFLYAQDRIKVHESFYLQPGLRFDYYDILKKAYISPRINASYAIDALTTLRAAWGLYYQSPGYEKLFDQTQFFDFNKSNLSDLRAERAVHYILGIDRWITLEWSGKFEMYFKRFDDLLVQRKVQGSTWSVQPIDGADLRKTNGWSSPIQVSYDSLTTTPVNGSYGEAYGFELTFEKRNIEKSTRLSGWITYSLAWAQRYRDGYVIPFNYDQRHD